MGNVFRASRIAGQRSNAASPSLSRGMIASPRAVPPISQGKKTPRADGSPLNHPWIAFLKRSAHGSLSEARRDALSACSANGSRKRHE